MTTKTNAKIALDLCNAVSAWKSAPDESARAAAILTIKELLDAPSSEDVVAINDLKALFSNLKTLAEAE